MWADLDGLAEPHLIAEQPVEPRVPQHRQPAHALLPFQRPRSPLASAAKRHELEEAAGLSMIGNNTSLERDLGYLLAHTNGCLLPGTDLLVAP
jgi:hypothetical protein